MMTLIQLGLTMLVLAPATTQSTSKPTTQPWLRIIREPSTFEYQPYNSLPASIKQPPGMTAHTRSWDECNSYVYGPVVKREQRGAKHIAMIRVDGFDVRLNLKTITWIDQDGRAALPKLLRHEHGHRRIEDRRYDDADLTVRPIAMSLIGQTFEGEGDTPDEAKANAYLAAGSKLANAYYAECNRWQWLHDRYDALTNYGRDASVEEAEAIRQAWREWEERQGDKVKG
jgi:hypothetical protein